MWIIPSNHPMSSAFVQAYLASKEDLQEQELSAMSLPTWKSKPSSLQTWLRAWKRVYWIPHLFGRMLQPSMHRLFVERYTESLEVIHVPENRLPGYEKGTYIKDSFSRLYAELSQQQDLFGAFSKTWMTTLRERIRLYNAAYEIWVMQLRQESTRRKKLAHLMRGKESSYSQLWPTSSARDWRSGLSNQHGKNSRPLNEVVLLYPTPYATMDRKYKLKPGTQSSDRNLSAMARRGELNGSQCHKDMINGSGKSQGQYLNQRWVAQLMGTTLEKIFFVPLATQWLNKQQN